MSHPADSDHEHDLLESIKELAEKEESCELY